MTIATDPVQRVLPICRWGFIGASRHSGPVQSGTNYRFHLLVKENVMVISTGLVGMGDYTKEGVDRAIQTWWECVDLLVNEGVDLIVLGGAPVSAQLGRARVRELFDETKRRTGLTATGTLESAIEAMHHLGVQRLCVGTRWADEVNEGVRGYLHDGGIEVVDLFGRGYWSADMRQFSYEERLRLEMDVAREAAEKSPTSDGLLLPGGVIAEHCIVPVEQEFGKTVFTNWNTEIWSTLVHPGTIAPLQGWGRLLASP